VNGPLADLVLLVHLVFVLFVVFGGLVVLHWPRLAWIHIPAFAWGVIIEYTGGMCPLTPLENSLRSRAGESAYAGGFIEHYVTAVLYPEGLTRATQIVFGTLVLAINGIVYWKLIQRRNRHLVSPSGGALNP